MEKARKLAAALHHRETALLALLESAAQSILAVNTDGRIVLANDTADQMFGYSPNELIGQPLDLLVPGVAEHSNREQLDLSGWRKNGSKFPIEVSLNHLETSEGRLGVVFVTDISERKRAQEALRQSELLYRGLFEHMNEGLAYCKMVSGEGAGSDFVYLMVNERFEILTGLKNVVGKRVTETLPRIRELDPGLLETYVRVALTGRPESFERFIRGLGKWYAVSAYSPEKGFVVAVFDTIDERKRTAEALRGSEERLRLAVESTGLGMFDFDPRTGKRIWSAVTKSYFGLPPDAEVDDATVRRGVHPDDWDRFHQSLEEAMCPESGSRWATEFRTVGINDGIERWISARGRVFFDNQGQPERILGVTQDLTERKRVEEALRQREQEVNTVLDGTPDVIMRMDRQFRYTYVNARTARAAGIPREAFIGKTPMELGMPQDLIDVWLPPTRCAFETGQPAIVQFSYPSPGAATEWEERFIPEFGPDGSVASVLVIGRDVTEQNRLERIAETSRTEIRALAASLLGAHEEERRRLSRELHDHACQELAALAICIGGFAADPPPRKELQRRLKALQADVVKTSEQVRHIAYRLHPATLDDLGLVAAVRSLCKSFSGQAETAVEFTDAALPASVPREVANCVYRIAQQCLQNTAQHAEARHVSVTLTGQQGRLLLTVADDGIGFDLEAVRGRGGLGLIGMEERARLVNGKLSIETRLGRGTRIALEVPLAGERE